MACDILTLVLFSLSHFSSSATHPRHFVFTLQLSVSLVCRLLWHAAHEQHLSHLKNAFICTSTYLPYKEGWLFTEIPSIGLSWQRGYCTCLPGVCLSVCLNASIARILSNNFTPRFRFTYSALLFALSIHSPQYQSPGLPACRSLSLLAKSHLSYCCNYRLGLFLCYYTFGASQAICHAHQSKHMYVKFSCNYLPPVWFAVYLCNWLC